MIVQKENKKKRKYRKNAFGCQKEKDGNIEEWVEKIDNIKNATSRAFREE